MKKERTDQLHINVTKNEKYRLKILAQVQSDKKEKRIYSADIVRKSLDGILRYNKDEIDAYIAKMGD